MTHFAPPLAGIGVRGHKAEEHEDQDRAHRAADHRSLQCNQRLQLRANIIS